MVSPGQKILEQTYKACAFSRSFAYGLEFNLLLSFTRLFKSFGETPSPRKHPELKPQVLADLNELFRQDAQLFIQGIASLRPLRPELPWAHGLRLGKILLASLQMSWLRKHRQTKATGADDEVPAYYQRNFHWQPGGYLTLESGLLYDHQVEILFKGTAGPMRRLLLRPLHDFLAQRPGAKLLEVAAGTGLFATEIQAAFPSHSLTVSDLSAPYLQIARERLRHTSADVIRAAVEELPFKDQSFDVLYGVFFMHELPREVRERALAEFQRVLRPGGLLLLVDSIQQQDVPAYQQVLEDFPRDYHEPFFESYQAWPLAEAFERHGFAEVRSQRGFLSKCVWGLRA